MPISQTAKVLRGSVTSRAASRLQGPQRPALPLKALDLSPDPEGNEHTETDCGLLARALGAGGLAFLKHKSTQQILQLLTLN